MKKITLLLIMVLLVTLGVSAQKVETGIEIGNKAPELQLLSPNGKTISLSDFKGEMVLVDFWASWCHPCRNESHNLVKAYKTYKNKNFKNGKKFTIYSVSLDKSRTEWLKAIKEDNLRWKNHVSDLGGWYSKAASIYGIRSIPSNFLIDADGIIVAKQLRGEGLNKALEAQLKK